MTATATTHRRTKQGLLPAALIILAVGTGSLFLGSRSDEQPATSTAPVEIKTKATDPTGTARDLVCDRVPPRPTVSC